MIFSYAFSSQRRKPRPNSKFIQRLDGIWFKPEEYDSHNQLIKWAYDNCDEVVWQSEFDKKMTINWWGERQGRIIHNGIKIKKAEISAEFADFRKKFDKLFVCSAGWHRQKRLKENIELFEKISSEKDALFVLGRDPDYLIDSPNIFYLGQVNQENCLEAYSAADYMLHLAWLDHCPNVVVEALSQNCPVICTDSGGTKEIVKENGIIIAESAPYNFELCDYDNPPALDLDSFMLKKVQVNNDHLQIQKVAKKYISLFKEHVR